ncbi:MAG TPA: carbohydrate porin [Verrucomicrobiales bacterium]|nr:carbohydrate porin [Verrucomicrobiales bacterium]
MDYARPSSLLMALAAMPCLTNAFAADAELEKLRAELRAEFKAETSALKAAYEKKIDRLEGRIATLEGDNSRLRGSAPATGTAAPTKTEIASMNKRITKLEAASGTSSAAAVAAAERSEENREAIESIERKLQASATETRDIYRDASDWPFDMKKFYDLPRPLEFHGYFRSGFGMNGEGGEIEAFKAPGAGAKYRLGNEAETYGEIGLTHNWLREDDPLKSPYVRSTVMVSYSTGQNGSYDSLNNQAQGNDFALRQAYIEAGNVFENTPDIRFWAGQRYYRRHDIHINDFYYLDMSGYGGGVEDLPVGDVGKLALAWFGGSIDNYATDDGNLAKSSFDVRLYDIEALGGKMTLWLDYSHAGGGDVRNVSNPDGTLLSVDDTTGWAVGLIHRTKEEKLLGGYNEFSIQYGEGAAYNFASTLDKSGPDLSDASRFRVTDHITIQPSSKFAMQAVGVYEDTKYGGPNSNEKWASFGIRPVYFFNDRWSLALEAGMDWVDSEPLGSDGHLFKVTLAPQLSRGGKFFSRPVIRPFITYANWSDGLRGRIGGSPYENATDGWSYGIQAEAWW